MSNFLKWCENVWNLRNIFDKYIPLIKEIVTTIRTLQSQVKELKAFKDDLEGTTTTSIETQTLELEEAKDWSQGDEDMEL